MELIIPGIVNTFCSESAIGKVGDDVDGGTGWSGDRELVPDAGSSAAPNRTEIIKKAKINPGTLSTRSEDFCFQGVFNSVYILIPV